MNTRELIYYCDLFLEGRGFSIKEASTELDISEEGIIYSITYSWCLGKEFSANFNNRGSLTYCQSPYEWEHMTTVGEFINWSKFKEIYAPLSHQHRLCSIPSKYEILQVIVNDKTIDKENALKRITKHYRGACNIAIINEVIKNYFIED